MPSMNHDSPISFNGPRSFDSVDFDYPLMREADDAKESALHESSGEQLKNPKIFLVVGVNAIVGVMSNEGFGSADVRTGIS